MPKQKANNRFEDLSYEDFKALAGNASLSPYEKIGFPDSYRKGKEKFILEDIFSKLPAFAHERRKQILDIGCGCSGLVKLIISHSKKQQHQLHLIDSQEMLDQLPSEKSGVHLHPGFFPDMPEFISRFANKMDCILIYSVIHYLFYHDCLYKFLDQCTSLLKPGGRILIGDIPNQSKRNRFFSTDAGIAYHRKFTGKKTKPVVEVQQFSQKIDDAVVLSILQRYRHAGFETYLLAQDKRLSMSNRREDIIIQRID